MVSVTCCQNKVAPALSSLSSAGHRLAVVVLVHITQSGFIQPKEYLHSPTDDASTEHSLGPCVTYFFMMDVPGSHNNNSDCISTKLCHLKELAQSSEWCLLLEMLGNVELESSGCMEFVLNKALREKQWSCVVELARHCSLQQRNEVTTEAATHAQWQHVLQLAKLGVASETKDIILQRAVEDGQWLWVREMLEVGVSRKSREWLCEQAVGQQQWDMVVELGEVGVGSSVRNSAMKAALAHCQVTCATELMKLGVSTQEKECGVRLAVKQGHCDFVLELVKTSCDAVLTDFVLTEALKQSQWQLVQELMKFGLDVMQLERVRDEATSGRQWDLVLQLLQLGVSPNEWVIDELFQNKMAQPLLDLFPDGTLNSGLRGVLLMTAIKHSQWDITLQIIQRQKISDVELMEAIKYSVHLLDKELFLQLLHCSPRSRRVFKQNFHKQQWKESLEVFEPSESDGGEIYWIFDTLDAAGEQNVALHVAVADDNTDLIREFYTSNPEAFDLKKNTVRNALRKLRDCPYARHNYLEVIEELCNKSKANLQYLFRQAIRDGDLVLAASLCEHGVQRKDLKFALPCILNGPNLEIISDISYKLNRDDRVWFIQCATRYALRKYFKEESDFNLKNFVGLLKKCDVHDTGAYHQIFRSAVAKAVKFNKTECFLELRGICSSSLKYNPGRQEDCRFAYSTAINGGKLEFISNSCEKKKAPLRSGSMEIEELMIITESVFETRAWGALPSLSAGLKALWPDGDGNKVLEFCLQEMLKNQEIWPECASALNGWLREVDFGWLDDLLKFLQKRILQEQWPVSVSSLTQWCLEKSISNLALFLGFVMGDWELVNTVLGQQLQALDFPVKFLGQAVKVAVEEGAYSTGAALLRVCPISWDNLRSIYLYKGRRELAEACREQGLQDWALTLSIPDWRSVKEQLQTCQNQIVWNYVLREAARHNKWKFVKELLTKCFDEPDVLKLVLKQAFKVGQLEVAEAVIGQVDLTTVTEYDTGLKTLLFMAVSASTPSSESENKLNLVHLCIKSGLPTFQRGIRFEENTYTGDHNCPMLWALGIGNLDIIKLMLACGAYTYERLYEISLDPDMQRCLRSRRVDDEWKEGYRLMLTAAANPCRLEHMARLSVSDMIGCRVGRSARIQSLPVPQPIKDLINFKDVISEGAEEATPAEN